jgi:hypothetical protein
MAICDYLFDRDKIGTEPDDNELFIYPEAMSPGARRRGADLVLYSRRPRCWCGG